MSQQESQIYDRALKSLMGDEAAEILPHILPEAELLSEENIEIDRTTLKADLVYHIHYKGQPHILNLELQTDADSNIVVRILKYHVGLHDKHKLPVISMIMYPFETSIPQSPYEEKSADGVPITFHYRILPLWKLDAWPFVRDHVVCMYTLLPAMKGVNASMLLQAIEEMKQYYSKSKLGDHLARFQRILQRSKTLSEQDKQEVEDKLNTYDSLMDPSPFAQRKIVEGAQKIVVALIEARFPALIELAQEKLTPIKSAETLSQLAKQIATVPDEATARWLLNTFVV